MLAMWMRVVGSGFLGVWWDMKGERFRKRCGNKFLKEMSG
jgi:hypothetical protein